MPATDSAAWPRPPPRGRRSGGEAGATVAIVRPFLSERDEIAGTSEVIQDGRTVQRSAQAGPADGDAQRWARRGWTGPKFTPTRAGTARSLSSAGSLATRVSTVQYSLQSPPSTGKVVPSLST